VICGGTWLRLDVSVCLVWVIRKIGKSRYMVMGHLCILIGKSRYIEYLYLNQESRFIRLWEGFKHS